MDLFLFLNVVDLDVHGHKNKYTIKTIEEEGEDEEEEDIPQVQCCRNCIEHNIHVRW